MASCGLCRNGLRGQFVAKSDGAEYVRRSNRGCGYFCSLDELASYERVVQLDVARTFRGGDAAALSTPESLRLEGVPFGRPKRLCVY